jgi:hypothetical protein
MIAGGEPDAYFTAIEEAFSRRRGAPLLLSPRDWGLIAGWQSRGVPLRIVLQGIENCFDTFERKAPGARRINSLGYCRQEVLSLFEIYLGLHAGATGPTEGSSTAAPSAARVVARHLGRLARRVKEAMPHASAAHHDGLVGALATTAAELRRLRKALAGEPPVPQSLEADLARLDAMLLEAARAALGPEELSRIEAEAEAALGPARDRMSQAARLTTLRAAAARLLRRCCSLPRLTLFEDPSGTS